MGSAMDRLHSTRRAYRRGSELSLRSSRLRAGANETLLIRSPVIAKISTER